MHAVPPADEEPEAQLAHADADVAPAELALPGAHDVHEVWAAEVEYWPAGQSVHDPSALFWYLPAWQSAHAVSEVAVVDDAPFPAGHVMHEVWAASVEYWPPQSEHADLPVTAP